MQRLRAMLAACAAVLLLAQCMTVTPVETPTTLSPSMRAASTGASSSEGAAILNQIRKAKGRGSVRQNPALTAAARYHARDMGKNNFMGHAGSNGERVIDRVRKRGYKFCWLGENVGKGQQSTQTIFRDWMNSSGHRRHMLNPRAKEFGFAKGPGNSWVLVLAQPC